MAILIASTDRSAAQTDTNAPDPAKVRVRLGPLWLNPTLSLTNAGVDTNVFNDAVDPKRDFTFTVSPKTDLWLRVGRTWISGAINEDVVWYQKYASERSGNNTYKVSWVLPLTRLTANVGATHVSTRERPGLEIDARSQHDATTYSGSAAFFFLSKTAVGVAVQRQKISFDEAALFRSVNLHDELSRIATSTSVNLTHKATPLTTLSLVVDRTLDRFPFAPSRGSNSLSMTGGLRFDPFALLKGTATLGYRDFRPLDREVPGYHGTTAAVDLTYTLAGATRIVGKIVRDVQYSYDVTRPYYLQTGFTGEIAQQIYGPLDIVGRAGLQRLEYRDRVNAVAPVVGPTDRVRLYGGGIGYHLGTDLRIGFNIDHQNRMSPVVLRRFEGLTYGTAVTYGF